MSDNLRNQLHIAVDRLPTDRVRDVLQFVDLLLDDSDMEPEEAWLLASGAFRIIIHENGELPTVIKT